MTTEEVIKSLNISRSTLFRCAKKIGKCRTKNGEKFNWTDEEIDLLKKQLEKNQHEIHNRPERVKAAVSNTMKNKPKSKEHKEKISKTLKSKKQKTQIERFRKENPDFKGIFVKELSKELNLSLSAIGRRDCIQEVYYGNQKLTYVNEEDKSLVKRVTAISKGEKELANWLSEKVEVLENDRTLLNGKELDVYIPEKKVAIEFDGLYWHSSQCKEKNYHYEKFDKCRKLGVRLIHVFEDEWRDKQEIVKSLILSAIGVYEKKYFARKCTVKEIEKSIAREFLEANHINGYVNCSKAYGLFNGTELLQVITVGKNRFSKEKKLELLRMATKLNTQVVGGFSKLLKDAGITEIESYVDNRLFNASGYTSSGWAVLGETHISYYYTNFESRFNRMKFQKAKLPQVAENDTEEMRANALGYFRIYDCGTTKLKYSI